MKQWLVGSRGNMLRVHAFDRTGGMSLVQGDPVLVSAGDMAQMAEFLVSHFSGVIGASRESAPVEDGFKVCLDVSSDTKRTKVRLCTPEGFADVTLDPGDALLLGMILEEAAIEAARVKEAT